MCGPDTMLGSRLLALRRVIAPLVQAHRLAPRAPHNHLCRVERLDFIRGEEWALDMLIGHRAVSEEPLPRGHGTRRGRGPQDITADALRCALVIGGMKDFGLGVAPDGIFGAVDV